MALGANFLNVYTVYVFLMYSWFIYGNYEYLCHMRIMGIEAAELTRYLISYHAGDDCIDFISEYITFSQIRNVGNMRSRTRTVR